MNHLEHFRDKKQIVAVVLSLRVLVEVVSRIVHVYYNTQRENGVHTVTHRNYTTLSILEQMISRPYFGKHCGKAIEIIVNYEVKASNIKILGIYLKNFFILFPARFLAQQNN
jgi:hypothetical protein